MKNKNIKKFVTMGLILISSLILISCNSKEDTIKIGVSPDPQGKIVSLILEELKDEGIKLEVVEFTDYLIPNRALLSGDIDLNFFQHQPYLDQYNNDNKTDIKSLGKVHIEPMALYSNSITSPDQISENMTIAIPADPVNGSRALLLLEENKLIKLDHTKGMKLTEDDIIDNPKKLNFKAMEAATIPRVLSELDAGLINGNYALQAGLNPLTDGIIVEGENSPYANIVAVRSEDLKREDFKIIMEKLQGEKVRTFLESYKGSIIAAF